MLSKCANPSCVTAFNYFKHGKLFEFDFDPSSDACFHPHQVRKAATTRKVFWLCGPCSAKMTLKCRADGEVVAVPLERHRRGKAA